MIWRRLIHTNVGKEKSHLFIPRELFDELNHDNCHAFI